MVAKFVSKYTSKSANMSRNTRSKTALNKQKSKDPNAGISTNTSGQEPETLHLDWSRVYVIFDNDDFSTITHEEPAYDKISNSQLHCIAARPPFMSYADPVKWALDNASRKEWFIDDHTGTPLAFFHPDVFARAYALKPPQQLLTVQFLDAAMTQFDFQEVVKSWMDNPAEFVPKANKSYLISWFRDPFSLLAAMLCRLYGLPNCTELKVEWAPIAHHILITSESFNWAHILSMVLKEAIGKYRKNSASRKPAFYLSRYVIDVFCATSSFPAMGWNWTRTSPLVHIYCSDMCEDNFFHLIYEISDHLIGSIYQMIFKGDAPTFSERTRALISLMGDWYVGEYFSYIWIWGRNTVHLLSKIVSE